MLDDARERKLLAEAKDGKTEALETLLLECFDAIQRRLTPQIPRWARSLVDVEDLMQQTFAQAFRDFDSFSPRGPGSFLAWLRKIADHRLLDALRSLKRKKRGGDRRRIVAAATDESWRTDLMDMIADEGHRPSQIARRKEAIDALEEALTLLSDDQAEAFRLRHIEGLDLDEIGKRMGRSPDGARGVVQRARARLREILQSPSRWLSRDG